MANIDTLPPPSSNQVDPDRTTPVPSHADEALHLSGEIKEEGIFASLISSFRDVFFPPKLPPLVLESKPIAVPDRMAVQRSPTSTAIAFGAHVLAFLLIGLFIAKAVKVATLPKANMTATITLPIPPPSHLEKMGGGGGQHDLAPASAGHLPPKAPPTAAPKLATEPTVVLQKDLKMADNDMPNLGMPTSSLKGASMGNGSGTGLGSGSGNGVGPGSGGNTGGGVYHIGGAISKPIPIKTVDPVFSEEARKAKFSGNVEVYLWVDKDGMPSHIQVVRPVGMGLDQKAVDAIRQYRFKPAMKDGKPVAVDLYIDVSFQIY